MKATWQEFIVLLQNVRAKGAEIVAVRNPSSFEAAASALGDPHQVPVGRATPESATQARAIESAEDGVPATESPDVSAKEVIPSGFIGVMQLYDRFSMTCQQASPTQFPRGIASSLKRDVLLFDSLTVTDWSSVGGNEFIWSLPKIGTVTQNQPDAVGNSVFVSRAMWGACIGAARVKNEVAAEINWLFERGVLQHSPHFELPEKTEWE